MHRNKFRPIAKTNAHRKNRPIFGKKIYIERESRKIGLVETPNINKLYRGFFT